MIIGFSQRSQTVLENATTIRLDVHSLRLSEMDHEIVFLILPYSSATVESVTFPLRSHFDAQFGIRETNSTNEPLLEYRTLYSGHQLIDPIETIVYDDPFPEEVECYTIRMSIRNERCYDNYGAFFCEHTICIKDNDYG